jgi:cbb3-type cytochrome c oxidase subunit I
MFYKKTNSAALSFLAIGSFWFVFGTIYGLFSAIHLLAPEFFNNIPFLVFGRVRPTHINTVLYGFAVNVLFGCGLYYMPALLKTRLWSEALGWLSMIFWNIAVASGPICFAFGITQGREYTEYVWPADICIVLSTLIMIFNLIMTITIRAEEQLYVSVWYFMATFLWTAGMYPIGNVMWHPKTGAVSGIVDSILLWFYGHNLPGLLLTPLAVGAAYFVIPRVAKKPLYSHTLSLAGFWTLVALYSHIGGHHLLQAPIPNWLKTISVIDSGAMVIPVFIALANLWLTARGEGLAILRNPAARFVWMGTIWYLLTCIQGPVQSLPSLQRVTHFNNWTIGHSHIAVLGFSGFIAIGTMWHILPYVCGRKIYSQNLINLQFWLLTFGLSGFFVVLTTAGLIQGHAWYNGEIVYRVLPEIKVYMAMRASLGLSIVTSAIIGFYNFYKTVTGGEVILNQEDYEL